MQRDGPEHRRGWALRIEVDGEPAEILARHHARQRLPRGHEIARQACRGVPHAMVEEVSHEWAVLARGRLVAILRQQPGGVYHAGNLSFPRMDIREAAAEALRRLAPHLPVRTGAAGEPDVGPSDDEAAATPGP